MNSAARLLELVDACKPKQALRSKIVGLLQRTPAEWTDVTVVLAKQGKWRPNQVEIALRATLRLWKNTGALPATMTLEVGQAYVGASQITSISDKVGPWNQEVRRREVPLLRDHVAFLLQGTCPDPEGVAASWFLPAGIQLPRAEQIYPLSEGLRGIVDKIQHPTRKSMVSSALRVLPPDWQDLMLENLRDYPRKSSSIFLRCGAAARCWINTGASVDQLDKANVGAYLSSQRITFLNLGERVWKPARRDTDLPRLRSIFVYVLRRRGEPNPEAVADDWITSANFQKGPIRTARATRRTIITEEHRQRALRAVPLLTYHEDPDYVCSMRQVQASWHLREGRRGINGTSLTWPKPGEDPDVLYATGGTLGKVRLPLVPTPEELVWISEVRKGSPFTKPGQLVVHCVKEALEGRCMQSSQQEDKELLRQLAQLIDLPRGYAFDFRAIRHRVLMTMWVNGASIEEVRAMAGHTIGSVVFEDYYVEPLELFEARKFWLRVMGREARRTCIGCGLDLDARQDVCGREQCDSKKPAPHVVKERSLDHYRMITQRMGVAF